MLMKHLYLFQVMGYGISLKCINNYIAGEPELYDGQHQEVEAVLKKVLGVNFDKVITYSRENNVVYSL